MIGWRARLGFLVPPGNPTVETEMIELAPAGVSVHFQRMVAKGATGSLDGQAERNQTMIDHTGESAELLAMVQPDVIVIAQKVVSKAEGRYVDLVTVKPGEHALALAEQVHKDPRLVEVILGESRRVLRHRPGVLIVEHKLSHVRDFLQRHVR